MKTIIAGSRGITSYKVLWDAIQAAWANGIPNITEVVSGTAIGVDRLGEQHARNSLPPIPIKCFPADWERFGKSAGYKRNEQMADYAEALIAVWDGVSKGTKHMIDIARRKGLKVYVHEVKKHEHPDPLQKVMTQEQYEHYRG